jgi:hypothetical protein
VNFTVVRPDASDNTSPKAMFVILISAWGVTTSSFPGFSSRLLKQAERSGGNKTRCNTHQRPMANAIFCYFQVGRTLVNKTKFDLSFVNDSISALN